MHRPYKVVINEDIKLLIKSKFTYKYFRGAIQELFADYSDKIFVSPKAYFDYVTVNPVISCPKTGAFVPINILDVEIKMNKIYLHKITLDFTELLEWRGRVE